MSDRVGLEANGAHLRTVTRLVRQLLLLLPPPSAAQAQACGMVAAAAVRLNAFAVRLLVNLSDPTFFALLTCEVFWVFRDGAHSAPPSARKMAGVANGVEGTPGALVVTGGVGSAEPTPVPAEGLLSGCETIHRIVATCLGHPASSSSAALLSGLDAVAASSDFASGATGLDLLNLVSSMVEACADGPHSAGQWQCAIGRAGQPTNYECVFATELLAAAGVADPRHWGRGPNSDGGQFDFDAETAGGTFCFVAPAPEPQPPGEPTPLPAFALGRFMHHRIRDSDDRLRLEAMSPLEAAYSFVLQLALERTRTHLYSTVLCCSHCTRTTRIHTVLSLMLCTMPRLPDLMLAYSAR